MKSILELIIAEHNAVVTGREIEEKVELLDKKLSEAEAQLDEAEGKFAEARLAVFNALFDADADEVDSSGESGPGEEMRILGI